MAVVFLGGVVLYDSIFFVSCLCPEARSCAFYFLPMRIRPHWVLRLALVLLRFAFLCMLHLLVMYLVIRSDAGGLVCDRFSLFFPRFFYVLG
jgi:hypothetical protein